MVKKKSLWHENDLQLKDRKWLHDTNGDGFVDVETDNTGAITRREGDEFGDMSDDQPMNETGRGKRPAPDTSDSTDRDTSDKRPRMNDDGGGDEPMEMVARIGGGGPNSVSKETPISPYPSLTYGLQETHTTILPWTGWLTGCVAPSASTQTPLQLKIRMNTPYDMLDVTVGTNPADGTLFTGGAFYSKPSDTSGAAAIARYPETFTSASTEATERPAWRDFWASLYDYYTVLGCEYKITILNPITVTSADALCAVQFDTYSDTATSTGNVMPLTRLSEVMAFKNIKWYRINNNSSAEDTRSNVTVIAGQYKPGQAKRNIVNDGDVKTWTATSTTLPNLKEILTLNFWEHPLAGFSGTSSRIAFNMQIDLKYIVQFKDLKQQARYPNSITTNQDITLTLNESNTAAGSALQRWA